MSVVADASPLIALARIGRLDLLRRLYPSIDIPRAVLAELVGRPPGLGASLPPWLRVRDVQNSEAVRGLRQSLDPGEAEAVILALELGARLLIDERAGRRAARALGVEVTGTVGVLLEAKRAGLIERIDTCLAQLNAAGFRMSDSLIAAALRAAGEQ